MKANYCDTKEGREHFIVEFKQDLDKRVNKQKFFDVDKKEDICYNKDIGV